MVKTSRDVISKSTKPVHLSPAPAVVAAAAVAVIAVAVAAAVTAEIAVAAVAVAVATVVVVVVVVDVAVATEIVVAAAAAAAIAVNPTQPLPRLSIMRQGQSARAAPDCFQGSAGPMSDGKGRCPVYDQAGRASAGALGFAETLRERRKHRARMMSSRLNPIKLQSA